MCVCVCIAAPTPASVAAHTKASSVVSCHGSTGCSTHRIECIEGINARKTHAHIREYIVMRSVFNSQLAVLHTHHADTMNWVHIRMIWCDDSGLVFDDRCCPPHGYKADWTHYINVVVFSSRCINCCLLPSFALLFVVELERHVKENQSVGTPQQPVLHLMLLFVALFSPNHCSWLVASTYIFW